MIFKEQNPIYIQIAERICDEILGGVYPEGELLPSVREYAALVEVNVNTLVRSYDWLSQKDIISSRRGLGYFVSPGATTRIAEMRREDFFHTLLPELRQKIQTLNININDVIKELTMKTTSILLLAASLVLASCDGITKYALEKAKEAAHDELGRFEYEDSETLGPVVERDVPVETITSLSSMGASQVIFSQGSVSSLRLRGNEKSLDAYETEVVNGELIIRLKDGRSNVDRNTPRITLMVSGPWLEEVDMAGAANIQIRGTLDQPKPLEVSISGAGNLEADTIRCQSFATRITGAGDIDVERLICQDNAKFEVKGAGDIEGGVDCAYLSVDVKGAGDVELDVDCQNLRAGGQGVGNITLTGRCKQFTNTSNKTLRVDTSNLEIAGTVSSGQKVPFREARNYFFRQGQSLPIDPMITSRERFDQHFGAAATMGTDGEPTAIDFDREFVLAVVLPPTDTLTTLRPVSVFANSEGLTFVYHADRGEKQTYTMQPLTLVVLDRRYEQTPLSIVEE